MHRHYPKTLNRWPESLHAGLIGLILTSVPDTEEDVFTLSGSTLSGNMTFWPDLSWTFNTITNLQFPNLVAVGGFSLAAKRLTTLNVPVLTLIDGDFASTAHDLLTLSMPSLMTISGTFSPTLQSLTSINLSALTTVGQHFSPNFNITGFFDLGALTSVGGLMNFSSTHTSIDLSSFATSGGIYFSMPNVTTLSLPALTTINFISITNGGGFQPELDAATSIDLSALQSVDDVLNPTSVGNLTTFTITSALKRVGGNVTITGAKLTQSVVNNILVRLAALDGTNGTTSYDNHTIDLSGGTSASPSGAGLTAKGVLEGRGNTVTVN